MPTRTDREFLHIACEPPDGLRREVIEAHYRASRAKGGRANRLALGAVRPGCASARRCGEETGSGEGFRLERSKPSRVGGRPAEGSRSVKMTAPDGASPAMAFTAATLYSVSMRFMKWCAGCPFIATRECARRRTRCPPHRGNHDQNPRRRSRKSMCRWPPLPSGISTSFSSPAEAASKARTSWPCARWRSQRRYPAMQPRMRSATSITPTVT